MPCTGQKANEFRTNITTKNDEADPNRLKYIELIGGSIPNRDRSLHSHQFIHTGMDLPMDIPFADFLVCVGGMQRGNRPWSRDSYRATPELIRDLQTMTFFYGKKQKNDTKQMTKFTAAEVVARPANMKDAHGRRKYRSGNKDTGPLPTEFYVKEKFTQMKAGGVKGLAMEHERMQDQKDYISMGRYLKHDIFSKYFKVEYTTFRLKEKLLELDDKVKGNACSDN